MEGSTLEVERAHQQAKRAERRQCLCVHTASRDMILRRYRAQGRATPMSYTKAVQARRCRNVAKMNVWSLAFKRKPELFPRAPGKLHWQSKAAASGEIIGAETWAQRRSEAATYVSTHGEELAAELKQLKLQALASRSDPTAPWRGFPANQGQWVQWLEENEDAFHEEVQSVRGDSIAPATSAWRRRKRTPPFPALKLPRQHSPHQRSPMASLSGCDAWAMDSTRSGFMALWKAMYCSLAL